MAVQPLHRRRGAGVPSAGGATGFLLPSSEARPAQQPRPTRPGPVCVRTRASTCSPARLRRPVIRGRRRCSMKALCAERTMYRILAATSRCEIGAGAQSPCYTKPELVATGPNQTWSWDITRLRGPKRGRPSTSMARSSPLRRGLDSDRENRARRDADDLSQASAPGAHPAFGPRRADDQQVRPSRRPRGHPLSEPPPGQR